MIGLTHSAVKPSDAGARKGVHAGITGAAIGTWVGGAFVDVRLTACSGIPGGTCADKGTDGVETRSSMETGL